MNKPITDPKSVSSAELSPSPEAEAIRSCTDAELSAMAKDDVPGYLSILRSRLSPGNLARALEMAHSEAIRSSLVAAQVLCESARAARHGAPRPRGRSTGSHRAGAHGYRGG